MPRLDTSSDRTIAAALALARLGRAIYPACRRTKRPLCLHGVKDATTDTDRIRHWFSRRDAVPAVATGAPSSVVVLDLDRQHGAADWWRDHRCGLPATEAYRSRSGGLHLAFRWRPEIVTVAPGRIGPGVELRSTGASAIYWPALGYPLLSDARPAELPAWVLPPPPTPRPSFPAAGGTPRPAAHVEAQLAGLVRTVAGARPGGRNAALFWASCRVMEMVAAGEVASGFAEGVLTTAAIRAGLDHREAASTIRSASRGGRA